MANKPITTDVGANAQYNSSTLNANFAILEDAIEDCLGRGGTGESPNSMTGDLDMDANDIINVDNISVSTLIIGGSAVTPSDLSDTRWYNNLAALKLTSLDVGSIAATKEYYDDTDYGGAYYLVKTPADYGGTPDGYIDHYDNAGNVLELQHSGSIDISQGGARPANSDIGPIITVILGKDVVSTATYVSTPYNLDTAPTFKNNSSFIGTNTAIKLNGVGVSTYFNLDNLTNVTIKHLDIDGNSAGTAIGDVVSMNNSTNCEVSFNKFTDVNGAAEGCVLLSGTATGNSVYKNTFTDAVSSGVGLSGSGVKGNDVSWNKFTDGSKFGVRVGEGANKNLISFNRTFSNGIELIGLTRDVFENRVIGNHAEGCGDNGISVSGYKNTVIGNVCKANDGAGIWVWGSFNTIVGNECLNNNQMVASWAGIGISSNFGGTGQLNVVSGNICDDDQGVRTQQNGVRIAGSSYASWVTSTAYNVNDYVVNGLNVYRATTSGTSGATPPTHTSGIVSDGGVSWAYTNTFILAEDSGYNQVSTNTVIRSASDNYFDVSGWTLNTLDGITTTSAASSDKELKCDVVTLAGESRIAFKVAGTTEARLTETELRPEVDDGLALGLTNRRFTRINTKAVYTGASGAQVQVVGPQQSAIADSVGGDEQAKINAILAALRAHGLIAT